MKFDATRHGRGSAKGGNAAIEEAWRAAAALPPGPPPPGEWVPWMAVWVKDGVSPRMVNGEAVERYAEVFEQLPPIEVQKETFALIDGRHRLEAAPRASSDFIRIREVEVSDEDLALRAFEANIGHGLPYTLSERIAGMKLMLRHYPQLNASELSKRVGVTYDTAAKYRRQYLDAAGAGSASVARSDGRLAHTGFRDHANLGLDDNELRYRVEPKAARPVVSSFAPDPEPEPVWDDDERMYDEPEPKRAPAADVPRRAPDAPVPQAVIGEGPEFTAACDWLSIGPEVDAVAFGRELKRLGKEGAYWLNIAERTLEWLAAVIEEAER